MGVVLDRTSAMRPTYPENLTLRAGWLIFFRTGFVALCARSNKWINRWVNKWIAGLELRRFLTFEDPNTKTQKRPNTEPQGVPEALDRFVGKVIRFSIISIGRQWLKPIREM